jgi:hypothetical protein
MNPVNYNVLVENGKEPLVDSVLQYLSKIKLRQVDTGRITVQMAALDEEDGRMMEEVLGKLDYVRKVVAADDIDDSIKINQDTVQTEITMQ